MAIKGNIVIDQGSDFSVTINVENSDDDTITDLTGYIGNAQMRRHYTSLTSYVFNVSISPTLGAVTMAMNAANTAAIPAGRYVYDCELTDEFNKVTRLIEGIVTVTPQVTR